MLKRTLGIGYNLDMKLPIFIGSKNDKKFLSEGLKYLKIHKVSYQIIVASTHREPKETGEKIISTLSILKPKVIIAGAATATGLPGVIAGYLINSNVLIFGLRFTKNPGQFILEDAAFNLSAMPKGAPLTYTGFNEKGFLHACILATRILKQTSSRPV